MIKIEPVALSDWLTLAGLAAAVLVAMDMFKLLRSLVVARESQAGN